MTARQAVVLFDIDGTLVLTGGAGRRAMRRAFDQIVGRSDLLDGFSFGGMTDYLILRTALESAQIPFEDRLRNEILAAYLVHLQDEVPRAPQYRLMPGVESLLARLSTEKRFLLGLGTGNIEQGARIKLHAALCPA